MSTVEVSHNLTVSMCRSMGEATMAVLYTCVFTCHAFRLLYPEWSTVEWGLWHMGSQVSGVRVFLRVSQRNAPY